MRRWVEPAAPAPPGFPYPGRPRLERIRARRPAVDSAPRLSEPARLRGRSRPDRALRDGRHERDDAAHPVGGARPGSFRRVRRRRRQGRRRDDAESAGRPRPPRGARTGRTAALRRQPAVRQQMVYAVAMRTIKNFERALGRVMHWPPCRRREDDLSPAAHALSALHGGRRTPTTTPTAESTSATSRAGRNRRSPERSSSAAFRRT